MKRATIYASVVEVLCPGCSEPVPNPDDGSHLWMPTQLEHADGHTHTCDACDVTFRIHHTTRPQMPVEATR